MTNISERALLVSVNISQWTARKLDKHESAEVSRRNSAIDGSVRANKDLLPMAHSLKQVHSVVGSIRNEFYRTTVPWMNDMGIIKAEGYMTFAPRMAERKIEFDTAVNKFLSEYEELREDAKYLLGGLYRDEDYPSPDEIATKFKMDVAFYPVPAPSEWGRLSPLADIADGMAHQLAAKYAEREREATKVVWERLHKLVSAAHNTLTSDKGRVHDTLLDNARELCSIMPSLNISDDPTLETMRQSLEGAIAGVDTEALRKDEVVRTQVSDKLADIMNKMGAMYGN
jgi:hypothetical protein